MTSPSLAAAPSFLSENETSSVFPAVKNPFLKFIPIVQEKVDVVVWDLDATLVVNNEAVALDLIGNVIKDYLKSVNIDDSQTCYRQYAGMPLKVIRKTVGDRLNVVIPDEVDERILARRAMTPTPDEKVIVHPVMKNLADMFREAGVLQCIATGSELPRALRYVNRANLGGYFGIDQEKLRIFPGHKPEPDCIIKAVEQFEMIHGRPARHGHIIGFEDSMSGVNGQLNANLGIKVIGHMFATHVTQERQPRLRQKMHEAGVAGIMETAETAIATFAKVLQQIPASNVLPFKASRPSQNTSANAASFPTETF